MKMSRLNPFFWFLSFMLLLISGCGGLPSSDASSEMVIKKESLSETLAESLGVSSSQAASGGGALLAVAGSVLSSSDFSKVISAIPDASKLLNAVPAVSRSAARPAEADLTAYITEQFARTGLSSSMVAPFASVTVNYLKQVGGEAVSGLFDSALGSTLPETASALLKSL